MNADLLLLNPPADAADRLARFRFAVEGITLIQDAVHVARVGQVAMIYVGLDGDDFGQVCGEDWTVVTWIAQQLQAAGLCTGLENPHTGEPHTTTVSDAELTTWMASARGA